MGIVREGRGVSAVRPAFVAQGDARADSGAQAGDRGGSEPSGDAADLQGRWPSSLVGPWRLSPHTAVASGAAPATEPSITDPRLSTLPSRLSETSTGRGMGVDAGRGVAEGRDGKKQYGKVLMTTVRRCQWSEAPGSLGYAARRLLAYPQIACHRTGLDSGCKCLRHNSSGKCRISDRFLLICHAVGAGCTFPQSARHPQSQELVSLDAIATVVRFRLAAGWQAS